MARESQETVLPERLRIMRAEIEKKAGKSADELHREREKRVSDAIDLKEPDRVPVVIGAGNFAARYAGVPLSSAYYDIAAFKEANIRATVDFEPDATRGILASAGETLEALVAKQVRWPGGNLPDDVAYQFVEGEYMKEDEYDLFLSDPTDFTLRYHLPRMFGALEPLSKLPAVRNMGGTGFSSLTPIFASPEFRKVGEALCKAGEAQEQWRKVAMSFEDEIGFLGFPPLAHFFPGVGQAPFDAISDFYRGMRGSMTDMFRHPDKLLEACEKMFEWRLKAAAPANTGRKGPKRVFIPLHRGSEGFMSKKQFETFYWPGLKKVLLANIDLGYLPMPFFEGKFDGRLEYLLELPKGKVVCQFDRTDMARAKEVLGGHACIMGNVPSSLLQVGSATEVEDYCRNLIQVCGKGGGFIMTPGSAIDEAKPENIRVMVDSVKKYRP